MDIYTLTELVRAELRLPEDESPDLDDRVALVCDRALQRLVVQRVAPDKRLRPLLLTDPDTVSVALVSGVGDLSALVTSNRILVECLHLGRIKDPAYSYEVRELKSADQGALPNALDVLFPKYWLVGTDIYTRGSNGAGLAGPLALAVPYWPTLAQLPDVLGGLLAMSVCEELAEKPAKGKQGKAE
jgi:hypothetical protein